MGLKDLFKPSWKHSDPNVRKTAVEALTDQALLADIAKNDESKCVRKSAVENSNLTDQAALAYVAKNDEDKEVRLIVVGKLTDQVLLAEIARNDKGFYVRWEAVKKLIDPAILADIAKNDEEEYVRKSAVENSNLTDQALLADIAKNDKDEWVRRAAVEKLPKDHKLHKIFWAKKEEVEKYTDQILLADIAKIAWNRNIREDAVEKLTDQAALAYVAKNDKDNSVRLAAVDKLIDQVVLAKLAIEDENKYVREAIVEKLTNQTVLVDIAKNDKAENVRKAAIKKLTYKGIVLVYKPESPSACSEAVEELIQIGRADLAEAVLNESFERLKEKAVIANLKGNFNYFSKEGADIYVAIHWWAKAITLDDKKELWSPYTYLSGVYSYFSDFREQASALSDIATDIRGSPVSVSNEWQGRLKSLLKPEDKEHVKSILRELWESSIKDQAKLSIKKPTITPGSVNRPDLACVRCGNANVIFEYPHTHQRCTKCGTIICIDCYKRLSWTCPKCRAHEEAADVTE